MSPVNIFLLILALAIAWGVYRFYRSITANQRAAKRSGAASSEGGASARAPAQPTRDEGDFFHPSGTGDPVRVVVRPQDGKSDAYGKSSKEGDKKKKAPREKGGPGRGSSVLMEDRKNDWLARQIREEKRIQARGSALDLGASHSKDCDAEDLRASHRREHDDSIDTGEL